MYSHIYMLWYVDATICSDFFESEILLEISVPISFGLYWHCQKKVEFDCSLTILIQFSMMNYVEIVYCGPSTFYIFTMTELC